MGSACCKGKDDSTYFSDSCARCRRNGKCSEGYRYCYDCKDVLCKGCVERHRCCCCCCFGCCCQDTKYHEIGMIPPPPAPTAPPIPPSPVKRDRASSPIPTVSRRLAPAERIVFKDEERDCWITGYDTLPNGKFIIADGKIRQIYIFSPEYRLLCRLYLEMKDVLDVAALNDHEFVFVYGQNNVAFVDIGQRYRHMEIKKEISVGWNCHRVRFYGQNIYLVHIDYARKASTIVVLQMDGMQSRRPILCRKFCVNAIAVRPDINLIYVSDISAGIRILDLEGNTIGSYRDIDVQWYYALTTDSDGNMFICTQDEFGPEVYELEQDNYGLIQGMKLHLTATDGLESPLMICFNTRRDVVLVGSNTIDYQKRLLRDLRSAFISPFSEKTHRISDEEEPDMFEKEVRERQALTYSSRGCSAILAYKLGIYHQMNLPSKQMSIPQRLSTGQRLKPELLVAAGKMFFEMNGKRCCIAGYDVLPDGKIIIADGKRKHLYLFSPINLPICRLRVKMIFDVTALSNHKLAFVYGQKSVVFVDIGKRYRHMEIETEVATKLCSRRIRHYEQKIYLACMNDGNTESSVIVLNKYGEQLNIIACPGLRVNSVAVNANAIFVTGISTGVNVFHPDGHSLGSHRDIDVQYYYGIACDKYGNVFVCTQDVHGPEVYELAKGAHGEYIKHMTLRLTAREGLEAPLMLCYNRQLDMLLVGANHIDEQTRRFRGLTSTYPNYEKSKEIPVEFINPYTIERNIREKHALTDSAWGSTTLDYYKIEYDSPFNI